MTRAAIAGALKGTAVALGMDEAQHSTHGLRAGAGSGLLHAGADASAIAVAGRWRSDAMLLYTRWSRHLMVGVASDMANVNIDTDLPVQSGKDRFGTEGRTSGPKGRSTRKSK